MKLFFTILAITWLSFAGSTAAAEFSVPECEAQIVANKNFQILKGKVDLLNTANQPTEILANSNVPSKKEKAAIALWVEEQRKCSKLGIEYFNSRSPEIGAIFDRAYSELFLSAADLYQGKITYGGFARASVKRHQDVKEQIAGVVARHREQQAAKTQQEAIARQQELEQREAIARQEQEKQEQQEQIRRERCESLKQSILIAANSGPTPYQIQQQRQAQINAQAQQYSQMSPTEKIESGWYKTGAGLGQILGQMLYSPPPAQALPAQNAALMQMITIYKRNCQD